MKPKATKIRMTAAEIKEAIKRDKEWMDNIGPDDEIQPPMPRGIFSQNICLGGLILLRSNQMQKCVGQKATETMRVGTLGKISQNVAQHIFIPAAMHDIKK